MKVMLLGGAALAVAALGATPAAHAEATLLGPTPYLSDADCPWTAPSPNWSYFEREDFEDGLLNTPGVVADAGIVFPSSATTDSVDGDDGTIDGFGMAGRSYFVPGGNGISVTFTFDAGVLGSLPTHAGIVWTDGSPLANMTFSAFDAQGALLASVSAVLGAGVPQGATADDRFFGVEFDGGVSAIQITTDYASVELDHLTYGFAGPIPAPPVAALLAVALMGGRRRRRG